MKKEKDNKLFKTICQNDEEFDKKFPCTQEGCDGNGSYPVQTSSGVECGQCQFHTEYLFPMKDHITQSRIKELVVLVEVVKDKRIDEGDYQGKQAYDVPMNQTLNDIIQTFKDTIKHLKN